MSILTDPVRELLNRLEGVKRTGNQWQAKCPAHDDNHASLSIGAGDHGAALVRCHAGCSIESITAALGIRPRDLFPAKPGTNGNGQPIKPAIVAAYDYCDSNGERLYQAVRYAPKDFRQRRPDGHGGWIWNMHGVQHVPYRLPDLLNSAEDRPDAWVLIAEGEKDVDRLWSVGLVATCNVGGAGKWKDEYSELLRDRRCCIIADKDEPGRKHARAVCDSLNGKAAEVRVIECPGDGVKDASDYLEHGGTAAKLMELVETAPNGTADTPDGDSDSTSADGFAPVSLAKLRQQYPDLREPVIDGLIRRGQVANVVSASKGWKTYLVFGLAHAFAAGKQWLDRFPCIGGRVLLLDLELQPPDIVHRTAAIAHALHVNADDAIDVVPLRGQCARIDAIEKRLLAMKPRTYDLVVIDPLYKTYPDGFDENSNAQMTALYQRFERLAEHLAAGLLIIHHGTKGSQSEKRVVDVGAGASAMARSADAHIALREHEQPDCIVFDARVRSFKPVDPMVLRWEYPLWTRDLGLNPEDLKTGRKSRNADKSEPQAKPEPWTVERFVKEFISDEPKTRSVILTDAEAQGIPERKAIRFIEVAEQRTMLYRWTFGPKTKEKYANMPQPVTATEGPK